MFLWLDNNFSYYQKASQYIVDFVEREERGDIDFSEFVMGLSNLSTKEDREEKLRFAFRIYDIDNNGFISNVELFQVLKTMVGDNLKDFQIQEIVDKTIRSADEMGDLDGKISFDEFCQVVEKTKVNKKVGAFSEDEETKQLWQRKLSSINTSL